MLWMPEKSLGGGGGDSDFLAKASGSRLMRLTITINEQAVAKKVMDATLSFAILV